MKPKLGNVLITIYLLLAGAALFLIVAFPPPGELAYLSVYGLGAIWLLTLPWSMLMVLFAWALIHDTQNPIFLLFFAGCAVLNAYIARRITNGIARKPM
jgi:hypothetical protein